MRQMMRKSERYTFTQNTPRQHRQTTGRRGQRSTGRGVLRLPFAAVLAIFLLLLACAAFRAVTMPEAMDIHVEGMMPLGTLLDSVVPAGVWTCVAGGVAIFVCAVLLTSIVVRYSVSPVRTYLPMSLYMAAACGAYLPEASVSAMLLPLILADACSNAVESFRRTYRFGQVFQSAFLVGMAPMLYAPSIVAVLIVPVTLVLYRRTAREAVAAVIGVMMPLFLCSMAWWVAGESFGYMAEELADNLFARQTVSLSDAVADGGIAIQLYFGVYGLLTLLSMVVVLVNMSSMRTRPRRVAIHFMWLAVICGGIVYLSGGNAVSLWILAVPCSVLLSMLFVYRSGWASILVYILFIVSALLPNMAPWLR